MTTNDELARLGEPPGTPEEEAQALRLDNELERRRHGERAATKPATPEAGLDPGVTQTIDALDEQVSCAARRADDTYALEEMGRFFPNLELVERLGQGGMGVVYLARHVMLDRQVALKVVLPVFGDKPAFLERFRREAKLMARLDHPGVVRLMDFGKAGDRYYLTMEYLSGGTLRRRMKDGPIKPQDALRIAATICEALLHAHEENVVHRDISPENILFDRHGNLKVADLGLARVCGEAGLTRSTQGMGKMGYMAPEQHESAATADHRADLYAVGVVLYEMLTGERPKAGEAALASRKVRGDSSGTVRVNLDKVDELIQRALESDPVKRFESAAHMKDKIEDALRAPPPPPPPDPLPPSWPVRLWSWLRQHRVAATIIPALTLVFLLGWWLNRPAPPEEGVLRWGADPSGGAPYVWDEGGKPKGFEAELIEYIGDRLKLKPKFVEWQWDMLPQALQRGEIDVIINGYGWSPERSRQMHATIPYAIAPMRLIVSKGSGAVRDWDDLRRPAVGRKLRVGTLRGSTMEKYLRQHYADHVEIEALGANGILGVLLRLQKGGLDASVQEEFTAVHYLKHYFPELEMVGKPVRPSYLVAYTRRDNPELRDRLNDALRALIRDGTLKKIYVRYGVWHEGQENLDDVALDWPPRDEPATEGLWSYAVLLLQAAGVTVLLACLAMPLAMVLGLLVALGRLYGPPWLRVPLTAYVEILRGTPLLLQLFVLYYLLPDAGIFLPAFWAGVIGLAINYSAYESENYRAGLLAVPRGQMEAALVLGMSKWTALRRIILPQALRTVVPPVTNDFISLFKDTSVCSVVAVIELTGRYQRLIVDQPQLILSFALMAAVLYLMMSYPLSLLARRLERRPQPVAA
jgi:polar amino acid transport system substrate-binding protein